MSNFRPLEVVSLCSETQLQVGKHFNLKKLAGKVLNLLNRQQIEKTFEN